MCAQCSLYNKFIKSWTSVIKETKFQDIALPLSREGSLETQPQ